MNKAFFENMHEQAMPDEKLVSSLRTKVAAQSGTPRVSPRFMQFMPLTAAACLIIIATVIIAPHIMRGDTEPYVGEPDTAPPAASIEYNAPPLMKDDLADAPATDVEAADAPPVSFALPISMSIAGISDWGHWDGGYLGHSGIDFAAPAGTEIYAAADGEVISAEWLGLYGRTIILDHGSELHTLYAHCSELLVNEGDTVTQGQTIALVGDSGAAEHTHLHFGVRDGGSYVNPRDFVDLEAWVSPPADDDNVTDESPVVNPPADDDNVTDESPVVNPPATLPPIYEFAPPAETPAPPVQFTPPAERIPLPGENVDFIVIAGEQFSTDTEYLSLYNRGLTNADIEPLRYMTNLLSLDLHNNSITDISILRELPGLDVLYIGSNPITDYSVIRELSSLTLLDITHGGLTDISFLRGLHNLSNLSLTYNNITDISPLRGMEFWLLSLRFNYNLTDLSPLYDITVTDNLYLNGIDVGDFVFPDGLENLMLCAEYLTDAQLERLNNLDVTWLHFMDWTENQELRALIEAKVPNRTTERYFPGETLIWFPE
jgi:biotin carboxyl carrier protein